ncbi:DUF4331 family protein [uncultured Winogradskyella sp.]|uniref:DUF4331 family protein n=1 Tax=uncultured Winogradskyella sp. TaxID=395353 RepID=UPI00260AEF65|nr:DUF4331 family protein [uncultured Winogradskyella sp.]
MKFNNIKAIALAVLVSLTVYNCSDDDDNGGDAMMTGPDFSGTYVQQDQMGRPAINTVFVSGAMKNAFNTTIPSNQSASFQAMFQTNLEALSPAYANPGDTNALGLDSATFTGLLATDVLNVSLDGTTTFFDGDPNNTLSGRALTDDVITVELILIFGGEEGLTNPEFPGLSNDNVDANDKPFLSSFPYLATPW